MRRPLRRLAGLRTHQIDQRRVPLAPGRDQHAVDRIGPVVDQAPCRRARSSRRRLRAPKDRQPQGPSRGRCRRPSRASSSPCATRASRKRQRMHPRHWRRCPGAALRDPVEHALGPGDAGAVEAAAGARLDRHAVARRAAARARQEQFVGRRREQRGGHRPAVDHQRRRDRPILAAGDEGARAVDRIDHPDAARRKPRRIVLAFLRQPAVAGATAGAGAGDRWRRCRLR